MGRKSSNPDRTDLLGALDLLVLRTLLFGPLHGQGIANSIEQTSAEILQVDHGSLYPALQRLQARGWISAEWGTSAHNRRAKYYSLTAAGRKRLTVETSKWERLAQAVSLILAAGKPEIET